MLDLFVYGSLKRGEQKFAHYCAGYVEAARASVAGQLYRQADGYPMLVVPPASVRAIGTGDGLADADLLSRMQRDCPSPALALPSGDWQWIAGDWLRYTEKISERLERLDQLEDFYPGGPSLYHRAIIAARTEAGSCWVWAYVAPKGALPSGAVRMGPSWP